MDRHVVCSADELPPGRRKIVEVRGRSIGVFNVDGELYALRNRCPHRGAPLCKGQLTDLVTSPELYGFELEREGEILRCPWHGWEFDITNGRSVFNPHRMRVKTYEVAVESPSKDSEPSIETYSVRLEQDAVVLYV